jgi:Lrp/AsnC family transcriptional regulator, leucine-responsive regulatory protein
MAGDSTAIDDIDREILRVLATDGRIGWQQLGPKVGLSPNAASERVRRMERQGVITGYQALVDPVALGRNLEAMVFVKMVPNCDREPFESFVADHDAIDDCVHLTGAHDYVMTMHCFHAGELDDILMTMKREVHVADTETRIMLRRIH